MAPKTPDLPRQGPRGLLVAVGDAAPVEVVGGKLDLDPIAGEDADVVPAHLARDVAQDLVVVVELDPEPRVREGLRDLALHLDLFFLAHKNKWIAPRPTIRDAAPRSREISDPRMWLSQAPRRE